MHIDRSNYEAYLIDYLEQNLDDEGMQAVRVFLLKNPDIADELDQLQNTALEPDTTPKAAVWNLTKDFEDVDAITPDNFEEFCIAYHEGDLNEYSKKHLEVYMKLHPQSRSVFNIYTAMPFEADATVEYQHKKKLKKQKVVPLRRTLLWTVSSAAAVLAGLLIYNSYRPSAPMQTIPSIAVLETEKPVQAQAKVISKVDKKVIKRRFKKASAKLETAVVPAPRSEETLLASLTPIAPKLEMQNDIKIQTPIIEQTTKVNTEIGVAPVVDPVTRAARISQLAKRNMSREQLFWEAMYASVRGFNKLTENQFALNTATNYEGKVTEFDIHAGNFGLVRKIKNNILN